MKNASSFSEQILIVSNFDDLVSTGFQGEKNAVCWQRELQGDFAEIVDQLASEEDVAIISLEQLRALALSAQGSLAREVLLNDFKLLEAHGAEPTLNLIKHYERDDDFPILPTDVYSFHVDRSPIPTATFLTTYHGAASEILPNKQATQKVRIPKIRSALKEYFRGPDSSFEAFLAEHYFDLHYQAMPNATPISLGMGNMWRLAVDHPKSEVLPCVHRAPEENDGQVRLLLIC